MILSHNNSPNKRSRSGLSRAKALMSLLLVASLSGAVAAAAPAPAQKEAAAGVPAVQSGTESVNAAATATISVDASVYEPALDLFRPKRTNANYWQLVNNTPDKQQLQPFGFQVYRMWIPMDSVYNYSTGQYSYNYYDAYFNLVGSMSDEIMLNILKGVDKVDNGTITLQQYETILVNILTHYKQLYPKIKYVEALNEWNLGYKNIVNYSYYDFYQVYDRAVRTVNAQLTPAIPLQVGGAVEEQLSGWTEQFLDDFAGDPNPDKRLDFISYHTYIRHAKPISLEGQKATLQGWLAAKGLDPNTPVYVTEAGIFGGNEHSDSYDRDVLLQASGMATIHYKYAMQGLAPFHWVDRHSSNTIKNILAPDVQGVLTPYGNMMKMQSMLKANGVAAASDGQNADGFGVYGIASADSSGVAVMAWNFNWYEHIWTNSSGTKKYTSTGPDYDTTIAIEHLPAAFSGNNIRVERYLIDSAHSNYRYNPAQAAFTKVGDYVAAGSDSFLKTAYLERNAVTLLVLTPTTNAPTEP
ncbi:hypothetical protein [Paenibacillus ginsengarvi]|uniref:Asl1-like glycosyl hydrolase catalytic domain-containing protein n=1 Tax=Paenibacillus ginsengarvi TaxID=400777 RepID=A0A3B0BR91_9BACL|nr:hypothetical protein [Paenibacillus ginsengarvi]RKN75825.1 hypothetical protein D7M11_25300 [Paenibacillus ginsengarvi]